MDEITIYLLIITVGAFYVFAIYFHFLAFGAFFKNRVFFQKATVDDIVQRLEQMSSSKKQIFMQALYLANLFRSFQKSKLKYDGRDKFYISEIIVLRMVYRRWHPDELAIIKTENNKYFSVVHINANYEKGSLYDEMSILSYDNHNNLCYASTNSGEMTILKEFTIISYVEIFAILMRFILWISITIILLKEVFVK